MYNLKPICNALCLCVLLILCGWSSLPTDQPPYLYYYSRLLGGLIIERADGTDSRQIGADVILPNLPGLSGPGWSPSGKYFAAAETTGGVYTISPQRNYLIDTQGQRRGNAPDLTFVQLMQWSPTGEDLLLMIGTKSDSSYSSPTISFELVDPEANKVLAEYAGNFGNWPYETTPIVWEVSKKQIRFYIAPDIYSERQYFQVTMKFDGTVLKEPVSSQAYQARYVPPNAGGHEGVDFGQVVSPSGRYEIFDYYTLQDHQTGKSVELPRHSQGAICRGFEWNADEQYIITLDGTGSTDCGEAALGVTDSKGLLWRELGYCTWNHPPCVGWLPESVDVSTLPPGAATPLQLDPVRIDYDTRFEFGGDIPDQQLICAQHSLDERIVDIKTQAALYTLTGIECPYQIGDYPANEGPPIVTAYDLEHDLLATPDFQAGGVLIWTHRDGQYKPALLLNTNGFLLEFSPDGLYLRARNYAGWKVYAIADILKRIKDSSQP